jgi:hypothetical protein
MGLASPSSSPLAPFTSSNAHAAVCDSTLSASVSPSYMLESPYLATTEQTRTPYFPCADYKQLRLLIAYLITASFIVSSYTYWMELIPLSNKNQFMIYQLQKIFCVTKTTKDFYYHLFWFLLD